MKNTTLKVFIISLFLLFLTGCYNLHQIWVDDQQSFVGRNIYEIFSPFKFFEHPSPVLGQTMLKNGNIEIGYGALSVERVDGKYPCRSFYEYEPKSGLIVGFRFEEDYKDACRIVSGA